MPIGVLFVCYANVCRSPLAEGVCRHLAKARGMGARLRIDSAGTSAFAGTGPHPHSVAIARQHGVELTGQSRQLVRDDLFDFDHLVLMDRANLRAVRTLGYDVFVSGRVSDTRLRLLRSIAEPHARGEALDVPDPIGHGPEHYAACYQLIERGCAALLDEIEAATPRGR